MLSFQLSIEKQYQFLFAKFVLVRENHEKFFLASSFLVQRNHITLNEVESWN